VPEQPEAPSKARLPTPEPTVSGLGYEIHADQALATPAFVKPRQRRAKKRRAGAPSDVGGPIGRGGLFKLPARLETNPLESLLYPLWDGAGLSWLVFLPAFQAFTGLVVFGLIPKVLEGGNLAVLGPFAFGMTVPFALVVGYTLQVLGDILITSATGDVHHPRWPEIDLYAMIGAIVRWGIALGLGLLIGILPAWESWADWHKVGFLPRVSLSSWLGLGACYGLMSLVSVLLFNDLRAAGPGRVLRAIRKVGMAYCAPCILAAVSIPLAIVALEGVYRIENFWLTLIAGWGYCTFVLYEGMVVMRVLGVCYFRHAVKLGWFPERQRWGVGA
jgi:hypothetical protein